MREGMISVCVDAPAQPDDCFSIEIEVHLGEADPYHPSVGKGVARRKAECLVDVSFGFCPSTKKKLGQSDENMSRGCIAIQRQCLLAFSNALRRAVRQS